MTTATPLRFHETAVYPDLKGPTSSAQKARMRALWNDVVKTPLHLLCLNLALDAYEGMALDTTVITIAATGERIATKDLILSDMPEHRRPRADLIVLTAERLGLPAVLLATVTARVIGIKGAAADASLARYRAVMEARALDDVQFEYDDADGYGAVEVWNRKTLLAANAAERAPRPAAPLVMPAAVVTRKAAPTGLGARVLGMFNR
ncbi:TPA: hypothetical protein QDB07_000869 [Burkholderia vietnamiensis]|nr:hypothetical protein [Burkholderia vietnamiensis]